MRRPKNLGVRRVAWLTLATLIAGAAAYGAVRESDDPRFALDRAAVMGARHTSTGDIIGAARFSPRKNIWLLDIRGAERRIENLPWIASARVERAWPNQVGIVVTERSPVARIVLPDGGSAEEPLRQFALVDATLRVLSVGPPDRRLSELPLFRISPQPAGLLPAADATGTNVEQAYDSFVQLRALGLRISEIDIAPTTGVSVVCDGGLRVILGVTDEFARKVMLFKAIAPKIASPENVVYVDLRSVRAPTVLYR